MTRPAPSLALAAAAALLVAVGASSCGGKEGPAGSGDAPAAGPASSPERDAAVPRAEGAPTSIPADTEVRTLPTGLRYCVLREGGGGPKPRRGDAVKVHYTGWFPDGKEFDSSRNHGGPATFVVGQVIEGWNLALVEMTAGARWKITIPPELGYGSAARGQIPGGSTLIFEVELLEVRPSAFRKLDPALTKTLPSGLKCQVVDPGKGAALAETEVFELAYTLFDDKGETLESSEVTGQNIKGRKDTMVLPFLKEAPFLVKEGGEVLLEVPPELAWGGRTPGRIPPGSTTYWDLKLVRIHRPLPAPAFEMPPEDKLEKTASGLKLRIVKPGEGTSPAMGDTVVVHYAGWLTDGTPFDSSYSRAEPASFRLGEVIQGWNEGLQRMKPGGTAWFVIPPALGYGSREGGKIPPNSTLVFEVELLEVKK